MKIKLCVLALVLMCSATIASAQVPVADYYSTTSKWNDEILPAGTVIEAFDGDDIRCGYAEAGEDGSFLIHVYGNDPMTPEIDEGASEGEELSWRIEGREVSATEWRKNLIGFFADLRFENGAAKEIHLEATSAPTSVEDSSWGEVKRTYR